MRHFILVLAVALAVAGVAYVVHEVDSVAVAVDGW
jgi:hypothetical protein